MRGTIGLIGATAAAAMLFGTCAPPADGPAAEVTVAVAALDLVGVGDVVWDLEVRNGAAAPQVVWQRRVSSSRYGDGAGSASLVGPCDADPAAAANTVRVWVVGVYSAPVTHAGAFASGAAEGPGAVTGDPLPFENPTEPTTGPLEQTVVCTPNGDARVSFDVALMRPGQQGFFDIAVAFNDLFCSAKFDCCPDPAGATCAADGSEDIALLFDAGGQRSSTMVLAFACTGGPAADGATALYLDGLQLDCTDPSATDFDADLTLNPAGPLGNQCTPGANGLSACAGVVVESDPVAVDADDYLFQLGLYRGEELLTSGATPARKVYWNVALGVKRPDITDCWLSAHATADDSGPDGLDAQGRIPAGVVYPYLRWAVDLGACTEEPLRFDDPDASVRPRYTTPSGGARPFGYGFGPALPLRTFCAPPCARGGICVAGACVCPVGTSGVDCNGGGCGASPDPCPVGQRCTPEGECVPDEPTPDPVAFGASAYYVLVGESLTLGAVDGTPPYTFTLASGVGSVSGSTFTAPAAPGVATVRVTDATGGTATATITVYSALALTPNPTTVATAGTRVFAATGGVAPYTYTVVSGGGSFSGATYTAPATAGAAAVRVTDALANTATADVTVYAALGLSPATSYVQVGGTQLFTASGGVSPYSYSAVSGGGAFEGATYTAPGVPGTATVRVTDSLGATRDATITAYAALALTPNPTTVATAGTRVFAATGGVAPYTYTVVSGGGSFSGATYTAPATAGAVVVRVTDALANTATASVTVYTALGLSPATSYIQVGGTQLFTASGGIGPYSFSVVSGGGAFEGTTYTAPGVPGAATVRVTDSLGATRDATITAYAALALTPNPATVQVFATRVFAATGGVAPYTYTVVSGGGSFSGATYTAPGAAGAVVVRVTDALANTATADVTVHAALALSPSTVSLQVGATQLYTASGGIGPYTFSVLAGGGSFSGATYTAPAAAGSATVRVTDSAGHQVGGAVTVYAALAISPATAEVAVSGTVAFSATGGVGPYTYSVVSGGGSFSGATWTAPGSPGAAVVRVTDSAGHTSDAAVTVNQPLYVTPGVAWVEPGAAVSVAGVGGAGGYSYAVLDGGGSLSGQVLTAPASGMARVQVTDAAGATAIAVVKVKTYPRVSVGGLLEYSDSPRGQTSCAVRADRTLWCWGENVNGIAGAAVGVDQFVPVRLGVESDWVMVSVGYRYACGVRANGTAWCWGSDYYGQLGEGVSGDQVAPVQIGTDSDWAEVTAGVDHSCGLRRDGSLWCWGANGSGQLGLGHTNVTTTIARVGTEQTWRSVASGVSTCGIKSDGSLWCWGSNSIWQLGVGADASNRPSPTRVGGTTTWSMVSPPNWHTCGVQTDGSLWCWGKNDYGQLGVGGTSVRQVPGRVLAGTNDWVEVDGGGGAYIAATCATRTDGTLWCWGGNDYGQFANGTVSAAQAVGSDVPLQVGTATTWEQVSVAAQHVCAARADQTLACWGRNTSGPLGSGGPSTKLALWPMPGAWASLAQSTQGTHACGVRTTGELECWGLNNKGQLGRGTVDAYFGWPMGAVAAAGPWAGPVAAGGQHSCAIAVGGGLWCWGANSEGQLGDGATADRSTAFAVPGSWSAVTAGLNTTCGIKTDGTLWCWGDNTYGQLGRGNTTDAHAPVQVGTATTWQLVVTSGSSSCGTQSDGSLWCWGDNGSGQLGDNSSTDRTAPVRVGGATTWTAVATGGSFTCGVQTGGTLWCWGDNTYGQLALGTTVAYKLLPTKVGADTAWVEVDAGFQGACARKSAGTVFCWGRNMWGDVGDGTQTLARAPLQVGTQSDWVGLTRGSSTSCAHRADGSVACWGQDGQGTISGVGGEKRPFLSEVAWP